MAGNTMSKTAIAPHPPLGLCRVLQNHEPSGRLQGFRWQRRAEAHLFTSDTRGLHGRGNLSAGRSTRTGKVGVLDVSRGGGRGGGGLLFAVQCSRALSTYVPGIQPVLVCVFFALCTDCSYSYNRSCCKIRVGAESAGALEDKINSTSLRCSVTNTLHATHSSSSAAPVAQISTLLLLLLPQRLALPLVIRPRRLRLQNLATSLGIRAHVFPNSTTLAQVQAQVPVVHCLLPVSKQL